MAFKKPLYKPHEYNLAGRVLVSGNQSGMLEEDALEVINNWRLSHYHPLNTFQWRLRRRSQEVDGNSLVAQRIKRMYSIRHKLERFPTMRLTQIQDIGGCRSIVSTVEHLQKLAAIMALKDKERSSRGVKHKLIDEKDYILNPKPSGYRGIHLVFTYYSDKIHDYDDLKIEIQLRTFMQHAWATAVETVGLFIGQALKSSIGQEEWLRFFSLASSAMAAYEGCPPVPGVPLSPDNLRKELRHYSKELDVTSHLRAYGSAMHIMDNEVKDAHYFLLELDKESKSIKITGYKQGQQEKASQDYLNIERNMTSRNVDAVLVSADSIVSLRKAYPNYFVDTQLFLDSLDKIIA